MAKKKTLSDVDKFFVQNNETMSTDELAEKIGTTADVVKSYRDSLPSTKKEDENEYERLQRLASGPTAGKLIAKGNGVVAMTEGASQVTDARKIVNGTKMSRQEFARTNRTRIHTIDPSRPVK